MYLTIDVFLDVVKTNFLSLDLSLVWYLFNVVSCKEPRGSNENVPNITSRLCHDSLSLLYLVKVIKRKPYW